MTVQPLKLVNNMFLKASVEEATHVEFLVPSGRFEYRRLKIGKKIGPDIWSWNGDMENPTFRPSVSSTASWAGKLFKCHSYITDGTVKFLPDCTHKYAGQTHRLREITDE